MLLVVLYIKPRWVFCIPFWSTVSQIPVNDPFQTINIVSKQTQKHPIATQNLIGIKQPMATQNLIGIDACFITMITKIESVLFQVPKHQNTVTQKPHWNRCLFDNYDLKILGNYVIKINHPTATQKPHWNRYSLDNYGW